MNTLSKPDKDLKEPPNYRPIALLLSISKVLEKIILEELRQQLIDKIKLQQSEFRSLQSITQQRTNLVDSISVNLNNHEHTTAIFIDVEKAFDRVWHLISNFNNLLFPYQSLT